MKVSAEALVKAQNQQFYQQKKQQMFALLDVAEQHSETVGQKHQMFYIGGKIGAFLVPIKPLSDQS